MKCLASIASAVLGTGLLLAGCAAGSDNARAFPASPAAIADAPAAPRPRGGTRLPELSETSGLAEYLAYAALNNPGLEAAFSRWRAALERVPQVRALPDPRFTYQYFIEEVETRVGAQRESFALAQMLPWFGKLELRGDAAMQAAEAERQRYEAAKLKLFYQVKNAYYEYYYLWRSIQTVKDNVQLLENTERVARTRYKAGAASHPDVIRLQVELGKLTDRLRTIEDLRQPLAARLNAALGCPADAPVPWPARLAEHPAAATDQALMAWLPESNPELKALDHETRRSRTQIDLAQKDYFPDVTVGMSYIQTAPSTHGRHPPDDGKDPVVAMVSVELPIWREKLDAGVREARARHVAAMRTRQDRANALAADLKLALYQYRDAGRKIGLYRDTLIPKAAEGLKTLQVAFASGQATFTDLIDAERLYLEFALAYERALANQAQRLAELEMLVGRSIPLAGNETPEPPVQTGDGKDPS